MRAAINHVLAASRDQGHCYLELENIQKDVEILLEANYSDLLITEIKVMEQENDLKIRLKTENEVNIKCYYSKSLYYDELHTAETIKSFLSKTVIIDATRVKKWLNLFNEKQEFPLSDEQFDAVLGACQQSFSILTGGPECGKTTTTKALVKLLIAMNKRVIPIVLLS